MFILFIAGIIVFFAGEDLLSQIHGVTLSHPVKIIPPSLPLHKKPGINRQVDKVSIAGEVSGRTPEN